MRHTLEIRKKKLEKIFYNFWNQIQQQQQQSQLKHLPTIIVGWMELKQKITFNSIKIVEEILANVVVAFLFLFIYFFFGEKNSSNQMAIMLIKLL